MTPDQPPSPPAPGKRKVSVLMRQRSRALGFREPLHSSPDPLALTMLWIPPGRFWMGSPATEPERSDDEAPLHHVRLEGFFMAQTPITQAQWREVASWSPGEGESWGAALKANPSHFQLPRKDKTSRGPAVSLGSLQLLEGEASTDQRPVESVSWHDAVEFCRRLSQRTGRLYTLPSEAQWEFACRAGTATPFAFGKTLTPELANCDHTVSYGGQGPVGVDRNQTLPVGSFPANAQGLCDMHGNVWEWCLDHWQGSYEGAPEEGGARLLAETDPGASRRLVRGGSWIDHPGSCRSADRDHLAPDFADSIVGFRVVCLPPRRTVPTPPAEIQTPLVEG